MKDVNMPGRILLAVLNGSVLLVPYVFRTVKLSDRYWILFALSLALLLLNTVTLLTPWEEIQKQKSIPELSRKAKMLRKLIEVEELEAKLKALTQKTDDPPAA